MKIYFCGSIQGGRQDAELYATIIDELKSKYGEVLTEFVGSPTVEQGKANIINSVMSNVQMWKAKTIQIKRVCDSRILSVFHFRLHEACILF